MNMMVVNIPRCGLDHKGLLRPSLEHRTSTKIKDIIHVLIARVEDTVDDLEKIIL